LAVTVQLPLAEQLPLDRAEIVAAWHERAGELENSGWPKGRAELKAFYELGDKIRSLTMPSGLGARKCAWCGNRCVSPMPARRGLAGVVVCNAACYSELWIDRRNRIDARLYAIGCTPDPTKEDMIALEQQIDELKAPG
jgi:hypothetical protein